MKSMVVKERDERNREEKVLLGWELGSERGGERER